MRAKQSWKRAEDLEPGDVIELRHLGRVREYIVSDVRHVLDGFVHVDTDDGAATSIHLLGDVVFLRGHNQALANASMSSNELDIAGAGNQNQP